VLINHQHPHNKSIMLAIVGAPNVGKSSLINYLLGTDLSVVTHKPQTTRNKFHCVFTVDRTEVILVDTPGIHKSSFEFNKRLNEQAREGTEGVDLNLLLIDLSRDVLPQFVDFQSVIGKELGRTFVVFTKSDLVESPELLPLAEVIESAKQVIPQIEKYFVISNKDGSNIHDLMGAICDAAQSGPHLYPGGEVSNMNERFFVTEYIREQAFLLLKEELPYEVAVTIDEYRDLNNKFDENSDEPSPSPERKKNAKGEEKAPLVSMISASIHVNRPSQRAIVVGSRGEMIKEIGTRARRKIEDLLGGQVHLNLHVKVTPKWFKNNYILEEIGLPRAHDSARVWRKK